MPDEYKIILEVQHREELAKLQKDFASAHQQLQLLNQGLNQGTISQGAFDARSKVLAGTLSNLHGQITKINSAVKGGIFGDLGGGGMRAQGLLQMGYAIDDLQYGLSAVVNNIPQVVMGLGGSAGIAGAVGIAAVAVNLLSKHWDDFFATAKDKFPELKEGLEGIEDNLKKIDGVIAKLKSEQESGGGFLSPLMQAIGFAGNPVEMESRLNQLKLRSKEGVQRLKDESLLESSGPEHTKAAEENAQAVAKAIKALPQRTRPSLKRS